MHSVCVMAIEHSCKYFVFLVWELLWENSFFGIGLSLLYAYCFAFSCPPFLQNKPAATACVHSKYHLFLSFLVSFLLCPRELTFTWWGCCGLCLWHKVIELAHSFSFLFLCLFLSFLALSTVFHSINSPDNSPLSHSVLPVLFLPYWSFQLYISLWKSPSALT